jgi:hypothetical protein
MGFIILFSYMHIEEFNHIDPPSPSPFALLPPSWFPNHTVSPLHSCHFLGLDSTFKGKRNTFLSLVYFSKYDYSEFPLFSCKQHYFILFMAK